MDCVANSSKKAQLKVQQMAFVLVAMMIFFGIAALVYFAIQITDLQAKAEILRENEARELVQKIASSPELIFSSSGDCPFCLDLDKAMMLQITPPSKTISQTYNGFWNVDLLKIERLAPDLPNTICTAGNYPNCKTIWIVEEPNPGTSEYAFVTLVKWNPAEPYGYFSYEIGKVWLSIEDKNE